VARLLPKRFPRLLAPNIAAPLADDYDEEEPRAEKRKREEEAPRAGLAFCCRPAAGWMVEGPGAGAWLQAAGARPSDAGCISVDLTWLALAAALADVAFFLGPRDELLEAAGTCRGAAKQLGKPPPLVFCGPFEDDAGEELDDFSGLADGFVIHSRPAEEPAIEAERLRRACATLAERLMLERGSWQAAPLIALQAAPDALKLLPAQLDAEVLLERPPSSPKAAPPGRLFICEESERRPGFRGSYGTVGPEMLWWRPWMRDPRARA